ncbi:MAG TPA: DsrE family protein [Caldisericia bacterium]|nr:DsrE family protein [Caldisericia bacterium]HOU07613.1 DsrE family protein [Caldisericia bacterium]HPL88912.1 DsrE family protein [Caldisericia bacterium]HQG59049.1 DsrE family protein [Caldisericia bacterium]HQH49388.1 DsrE family protein [Caldisericia bacterium]
MKLGIVVLTTPYTFQNMDTAISLAGAALEKGHQAMIFLYMDGVIAASNLIKPGNDRSIPIKMQSLIEKGVKITPCGVCCNYRGVRQADSQPGIKHAGIAALGQLVSECDRVLTLGF